MGAFKSEILNQGFHIKINKRFKCEVSNLNQRFSNARFYVRASKFKFSNLRVTLLKFMVSNLNQENLQIQFLNITNVNRNRAFVSVGQT